MKKYLYLGELYDVLGRAVGIRDKKIGTTNNPDQREAGLTDTKAPIQYRFIGLWETIGDAYVVEQALHALYDDRRTRGEYIRDDNETLASCVFDYMKIMGHQLIPLTGEEGEREQEVQAQSKRAHFWDYWREYAISKSNGAIVPNRNASRGNWTHSKFSLAGCWVTAVIRRGGILSVSLATENKALFKYLQEAFSSSSEIQCSEDSLKQPYVYLVGNVPYSDNASSEERDNICAELLRLELRIRELVIPILQQWENEEGH